MKSVGGFYKSNVTPKADLMRILSFFVVLVLLSVSCKKRKEIKEWKKREGIYQTATTYVLYEDSTIVLGAKEIHVGESGITCYGESGAGTNFSVFHKDENLNKNYEYKCQYASMTNFSFGQNGVTNTQLPFEQFTQEREFYLTFSGNQLTFSVIHQNGSIDNVVYQKQ